MNPWVMITLAMAGIVFGIDYLFRKRKWKNNSKQEKISLLVNMFCIVPHLFLSVLGMLWGFAANSPKTTLGEVLYNLSLVMGGICFFITLAAVIASLILRKKEKVKASIWVNLIAFAYIAVVLTLNSLVGKIL